jgi:hypothetical protein
MDGGVPRVGARKRHRAERNTNVAAEVSGVPSSYTNISEHNPKGKYVKKLVLLLIISILSLTACSDGLSEAMSAEPAPGQEQPINGIDVDTVNNGDASGADNTPPPVENDPVEDPGFALVFNDFLIEMDLDMSYVLSALGEPLNIFEAPSCAFDGIDRIFLYPGIQIHTYPVNDHDFVHTISIRNDSIRTTEGSIYLGLNRQSMLDAYGDDYEHEAGMYTYKRGSTILEFFIEDDIIVGITYGLIVELH